LNLDNHVEIASTLSVIGGVELGSSLSVSGDVHVNSSTNAVLYTNTIKTDSDQQGGGQLVIDVDTLRINGNLDVAGVYNTVDVDTTNIHVEDKLIILATSPDFVLGGDVDSSVDDSSVTNGAAGMKIAGKPSTTNLSSATLNTGLATSNLWEKSFKWNYGSGYGMPSLGYLQDTVSTNNNNRDDEPTWEVKGGPLYIVADKMWNHPTSGVEEVVSVKYGFRINANDELEMVKRVVSESEAFDTKRIAKFGVAAAF
jgi:hypothetical protein